MVELLTIHLPRFLSGFYLGRKNTDSLSWRERPRRPLPSSRALAKRSSLVVAKLDCVVADAPRNDAGLWHQTNYLAGGGKISDAGAPFCNSGTLIFTPPGMMTSPGFWPAAQAPSHLLSIVIFTAGSPPPSDVTVIV